MILRQPDVVYLPSWGPRPLPMAWLARRAGRPSYTAVSLGYELAALRRMLRRPGAIYHAIYGEDDHHLLGRAAPLVRPFGGRVMATFHQPPGVFDEAVGTRTAARILPRLDAAIVMTDHQREHLARWMPADRVHVVRHGVACEFFSPGPPRGGDGPLTLITVGTWLRDFGTLEVVARAMAATGTAVRFEVVTAPGIADRLRPLPGVHVHSGVSDERLRELYRSADALLLPLIDAGANNALLEGMACGLPVIASDLPAVREYTGDCGARLVPPFDARAAIVEIGRLADPALRAELGRRSRKRAEAYGWDRAAEALGRVYAQNWRRVNPRPFLSK